MGILFDFSDVFETGQQITIMPVSRLVLERPIEAGGVALYPAGEIDFTELRPVTNQSVPQATRNDRINSFSGQTLREVCSDLSGFDLDVLSQNALVAFTTQLDWDAFLGQHHRDDITLLRKLNHRAEAFLDAVRFECCRFDLPDTLPGRAGSWEGSGPYWGSLIYNPADNESYLIAGAAALTAVVVKGLGLELNSAPTVLPEKCGVVGGIAKHSLALFRDVLEANSETQRFTRSMTLLQFLAFPNSYANMQEAKKEIAAHVASDQKSYQHILERFPELTGKIVNGRQSGLRTLLVHHGQFLEDVVPDQSARQMLFREIQGYASAVIADMIARPSLTWEEFVDYRRKRRRQIGVSK